MSHEVYIALIVLIQGVAVAIIGGLFNREAKKRKRDHEVSEKRAKLRAREGLLAMKLMAANNSISLATARAVRDGKSNGEMEDALIGAEHAQREYYDFINELANEQLAAD